MRLVFEKSAFEDLQYWTQHDKKISKKVLQLVEHTLRDPYTGIGKPERLKNNLSGLYSRRISQEHRLVYKVEKDELVIYSCRYHY